MLEAAESKTNAPWNVAICAMAQQRRRFATRRRHAHAPRHHVHRTPAVILLRNMAPPGRRCQSPSETQRQQANA